MGLALLAIVQGEMYYMFARLNVLFGHKRFFLAVILAFFSFATKMSQGNIMKNVQERKTRSYLDGLSQPTPSNP